MRRDMGQPAAAADAVDHVDDVDVNVVDFVDIPRAADAGAMNTYLFSAVDAK